MQFTVNTTSGSPTSGLSFTIEVPDSAAREYTTVVNTGIAAVVAKAGELLIGAESGGDMASFKQQGMEVAAKILAS